MDSPEIRTAIDDLLERKRTGQELDRQPKIKVLSDLIATELARLEKIKVREREKPDFEKLNALFRNATAA